MKIVLATPLYPPEIGGPSTYIKELAERLRDIHDIVIVAYATTSEKIPGTKLITVSKRSPLPLRLIKYSIVLFRASKNADVMYVQNAVASGLPALIVGKLRGIPVVIKFVGDEAWERATQLHITTKQLDVFLRNPEGPFKIRLLMFIQRLVLPHVQKVTTPSVYLSEVIIDAYQVPKERTIVNYNAAEKIEKLPFPENISPHQIVTTARLVEWKGIDGIIRAVALLVKEFPDVRLLIAGDGPEEENLKALARDQGVSEQVIFLGRVSRAETWHIRKTSQVYVLNSTYEGLPHVVLTSFAARIPVVATDIPGTNEAVFNEQSGLLVPPGDDRKLADALARIFNDASLRSTLIEGGEKILREKFSWETHIQKLTDILESVCTKPRH